MVPRKPLAPNNRSGKRLSEFLVSEAIHVKAVKAKEKASVFHYARAGRQNSEGFGGGYRVY